MQTFASVTLGRERCAGGRTLPRHRHRAGYACLVLAGGYEEAGDFGRADVRAGDVVFHKPFDAHLDRFLAVGADTINFELDGWSEQAADFGRVNEPDLIARVAERDATEARDMLLAMMVPAHSLPKDWPDELATSIRLEPNLNLACWAKMHGLAVATLSRGFRRVYGITPSAFRAQMRARHAWRSIMHSQHSLSMIAAEKGFADQAHMTRAVGAITGHTPSQWRSKKSNRFKTGLSSPVHIEECARA